MLAKTVEDNGFVVQQVFNADGKECLQNIQRTVNSDVPRQPVILG